MYRIETLLDIKEAAIDQALCEQIHAKKAVERKVREVVTAG